MFANKNKKNFLVNQFKKFCKEEGLKTLKMTKRQREDEKEKLEKLDDSELFKEFEDIVWDIVYGSTEMNSDETGLVPYFKELKKRFPQFQNGDDEYGESSESGESGSSES